MCPRKPQTCPPYIPVWSSWVDMQTWSWAEVHTWGFVCLVRELAIDWLSSLHWWTHYCTPSLHTGRDWVKGHHYMVGCHPLTFSRLVQSVPQLEVFIIFLHLLQLRTKQNIVFSLNKIVYLIPVTSTSLSQSLGTLVFLPNVLHEVGVSLQYSVLFI